MMLPAVTNIAPNFRNVSASNLYNLFIYVSSLLYIRLSCSQYHHPIKLFMFWYKIVFTGPIFQFAFKKIITIHINIIKERLLTTNQIMKTFYWPHLQTHTCTHTDRRFLSWTRECPACTQATQKTSVNCAFVILLPLQGAISATVSLLISGSSVCP